MSQGVDLSAVATLAPQLSETPTLDPQSNMLRLKGTFPGKPVQIKFELIFQPIAGRWRLFGLSVQPEQSAADTPAPPANPAKRAWRGNLYDQWRASVARCRQPALYETRKSPYRSAACSPTVPPFVGA